MKSPNIYLIRHGETEWTLSRQHTGLTDIPLTEDGIEHTKALASRLDGFKFDKVFVSPLQRAALTCEICGYDAEVTDALLEWDYGDYEGMKSAEIHKINPDWNIFTKGAPKGESTDDVKERVDAFLDRVRKMSGNIAFFSSGHISRAIAAR